MSSEDTRGRLKFEIIEKYNHYLRFSILEDVGTDEEVVWRQVGDCSLRWDGCLDLRINTRFCSTEDFADLGQEIEAFGAANLPRWGE